ncbi:hypothetical protein ACIBG8_45220 [Nonomuraea sp. NPDC050556]|uniref:pPIWI_RE_Z domain-containing protein n=1 Tax=Nonomuraea sp. NPDC050556 TaxID=3364369 RepID=UPI00379F4421
MRDSSNWRNRQSLAKAIRDVWNPEEPGFDIADLLDVELGLSLLETVAPTCGGPEGVWTLLGGYPIADAVAGPLTPSARQAIRVARELLPSRRAPQDWTRLIRHYRDTPEWVRGYLIEGGGSEFWRRSPRVAPFRFDVYAEALASLPRYRTKRITRAEPGIYSVAGGRTPSSVRIPDWLPEPLPIDAHDLAAVPKRPPFRVTFEDLRETAVWTERREAEVGLKSGGWGKRIHDVTLAVRAGNGQLAPGVALEVEGMYHLLGMVGAGKSTLMDLLCIHAAKSEPAQRITMVVGDVTSLIRKVVYFNALGLNAAPIIGQSNRSRHVERLHRLTTVADDTRLSTLGDRNIRAMFNMVSTACALDGLRDHSPSPWDLKRAPCTDLRDPDNPDRRRTCPLWSRCARHQPARDLVAADIWVATMPGLVYSQIPGHINKERLRYLEAAWRRSDLIIVDEADQAQAQVDTIFSPSQTLRSRNSEAWLDEIIAVTQENLRRTGWVAMNEPQVRVWTSAANTAKTAVDLMYMLLRIDTSRKPQHLARWIDEDYFTDWTLAQQLAQSWCGYPPIGGKPKPGWEADSFYQQIHASFNEFIDAPLGDHPDDHLAAALTALAKDMLSDNDEERRLGRIKDWLDRQAQMTHAEDRQLAIDDLDRQAVRLEFTIAVAVLGDQLQVLLSTWKSVEDKIGLEASNPLVFHRPPRDLLNVAPDSPMGRVLGFQYRPDDTQDSDQTRMGELRFFRSEGVGRWVLTHMSSLFADRTDNPANVLLMSGTSWAGTSPRYNIDVPVQGILQPNPNDIKAIARSKFEFLPIFPEGKTNNPIRVSGTHGERRTQALEGIVRGLARRRPDGKSILERHRERLPPGRQRALLLTGSYEEAKAAARTLARARPGWDEQVCFLVPDDDEFADRWDGPTPLRRGDVADFADTGAWILIAPLLAIERGHNILNEEEVAALGAAYFLVRPHPRPDDLTYVTQRLNQWATREIDNLLPSVPDISRSDLNECGRALRASGHRRWRKLLHQRLAYSSLKEAERDALIWTQLVTIWQVIGRLVRGGQDAQVFFCDAAFAPNTAGPDDLTDTAATSLVIGLRSVLDPYFDLSSTDPERFLVEALYGPLHQALRNVKGM